MTVKQLSEEPQIAVVAPADQDIRAIFAAAREHPSVARNPIGRPIALRGRHLETLRTDAGRQIKTATQAMQGVTSQSIIDLSCASLLFSNGDAHRPLRQPLARAFAFKLMQGLRPMRAVDQMRVAFAT